VSAPFAGREPGLNRVYWALREGAAPPAPAAGETRGGGGGGRARGGFGPYALPGAYKAVLEVNGKKMEAPFTVKEDPDQGISMEQRQTAQKFARESQDLAQKGRALLQALDATGKQLDDVAGRVAGMKNPDAALAAKVKAVKDKVEAIKAVFYVSPPDQGFYRKPLMVAFRGGTAAELVTGGSRGFGSMGAPTQTVIDQFNDFKAFAEPLFQKMKDITEKDVPELNKLLAEKGVPYIK
jgi:hypothetical protein